MNDESGSRSLGSLVRRCPVCTLLPPWIRMRAAYEVQYVAKPASPRGRRRPKIGAARMATKALNSRIDGLVATVSLGGRSC